MDVEKFKEEQLKFFAKDATQTFVVLFVCLTTLFILGYIGEDTYSNLIIYGIIGFFGGETVKALVKFRGK